MRRMVVGGGSVCGAPRVRVRVRVRVRKGLGSE